MKARDQKNNISLYFIQKSQVTFTQIKKQWNVFTFLLPGTMNRGLLGIMIKYLLMMKTEIKRGLSPIVYYFYYFVRSRRVDFYSLTEMGALVWDFCYNSVVKRGVSFELGLFNYIFSYRRFQSRESPSTIKIIHLPQFCQVRHLLREVEYLQ